jgi:tetrahydromethanopterin S-methyltransferase subunit G
MADTDARPVGQDELVADIDRTRAELARTIDAISDRVSPKKNMDRAMEQVRQRVVEVSQRAGQRAGEVSQRAGQRVGKVDPLVVGAAAAAAVLVGVTVIFLVRRRNH